MIKYAKIINKETGLCEVGLGTNTSFYQSIGMKQLDVQQSDLDGNWYLAEKCPMKTDEQKELEEAERIGNLTLTKRVFALALQGLGITYTQLKELIATNEQAQLEWDLCVELERKNPLLDIMALQLGVTSPELDYIFQKANGEDVEPPVRPVEPEADEQVKTEEELPTDETVLPEQPVEETEDENTTDTES